MTNKIQCLFGWDCNNNCIYCTLHGKECSHAISVEEIPKVIETIGNTKDAEVEIAGGEPTLKQETFYFLEQLSTNLPHIKYVLLTNGRKFSNPILASRMSELTPHNIVVPVHADTPWLHDRITQSKGSFNETMLGIKNLYAHNLPVTLKTVVNKQSYKRLPQLVEMLAQKFPECTGMITNMVILNNEQLLELKNVLSVRLSDTRPYVEEAIDTGERYGFKVQVYSIPPCILREEYQKYLGIRAHSAFIRKDPAGGMRRIDVPPHTPEKCKRCRHIYECDGVWDSYFDIHGTDEITPIE